ncbi:MAG: alpha-L-fucosidase, partial [Acidobacteriota bacterium]
MTKSGIHAFMACAAVTVVAAVGTICHGENPIIQTNFGPWRCKGTIMDPSPLSDGNHPGIIDFKGTSYLFGFNYELLFSIQGERVKRERRSICVKEMTYSDDGSIKKVSWWGKGVAVLSVPQVGHLDPYVRNEAETIHAIIDVAIPADAVLTVSLADSDVPVNIDRIVVGDGDLGLPPDIWNLPPLKVADGPYSGDWKAIARRYTVPEWWRDAKFGAWSHWDPQSMPEQGDWYARGMYMQGSRQYNYHLEHFGHPS